MREIKFRGRSSKDNKTWFTGSFVSLDEEAYIEHFDGLRRVMEIYPVAPPTVGQFTGMYDAEGRGIYEGDIVKATLKEPSFVKRFRLQNELVGEMFFDNAWWMKERETVNLIPPWRLRYYDLTVIGNVYDSPELLEADHERD